MHCLNKLFQVILFLKLFSSMLLWIHLWFDLAVILDGLLLLHCIWEEVCIPFFSFILVTTHGWTCKICTNYLKRSCSCSSLCWKNALFLCSEWFSIDSFACKLFSGYSFCYLSQSRNPAIFLDNSHCQYDPATHRSLVSFIDDFLS